jgi:hypothetical protein
VDAEHVAETLDVGPGTRVFEVECGDGAFLIPFHDNGFIVGGLDADATAVAQARAAMPGGSFQVGPATALDPAAPWDVVICRTFGRSQDTDFMRGVLARMFAKATHAIALLDLPDDRRQWIVHALAEIGAQAIQIENATSDDSRSPDGFHAFARI